MAVPLFQPNPDEEIFYHSQPSKKWYSYAWNIGVGVFEAVAFTLFSLTTFTALTRVLLATFLSAGWADVLSRVVFQGILPLLVTAWLVEETVRGLTSELILTNQRIWTRGSPYAWSPGQETPLSDIKSMTYRREALFIRLKSTRKTLVHLVPDGKLIAKAFNQITGKTGNT
jgi:hypothetical protein